MANGFASIDIGTMPELARLVEEIQRTHQPQVLRRDNQDVAVIIPTPPPARRRFEDGRPGTAPALRFPKGGVLAATAGIVRYGGPPLTIEQETDAFERKVAKEVMESMGG